jgi:ATP-dependent Clp protease protease subunit
MATQGIALPPEVYGLFSDAINQASLQRIFNTAAVACKGGVRHAHILFQSVGGFVGDGIALYNFFRTIPIELTLYNAGSVQSIATVAFLAAAHRKVSANGSFQIHLSAGPPLAATLAQIEGIAEGIQVDDARTEAILRKHLRLSDEEWTQLVRRGLTFGASASVDRGFADEIAEFSPPPGTEVFNI